MDEMGSVYFQVVPLNASELESLDRDLALKRLRVRVAGLNQRLSSDPRDADALQKLGDLYLDVGAFSRAVLYYRWALETAGEDAHTLYHLGAALLEEGQAEEAASHFLRVTALLPDEADGYHALAVTLVRLGRLEEAIVQYRRTILLDPDHPEALQNLGALLVRAGASDEGLEYVLQAARRYVAMGEVERASELVQSVWNQAETQGNTKISRQSEELMKSIRP